MKCRRELCASAFFVCGAYMVPGLAFGCAMLVRGAARFMRHVAMLAGSVMPGRLVRRCGELGLRLRDFRLLGLRLFRSLLFEAGEGRQAAAGQRADECKRRIVDRNFSPRV